MRRMLHLLAKDIVLGIKDVFILLEIAFAVVLVLLLVFVVPEKIETDATVFISDETGLLEPLVDRLLADVDADIEGAVGDAFVDGRDAVIEGMIDNRSALGLVLTGDGRYEVEVLVQPYTPPAIVESVKLEIADLLSVLSAGRGGYSPEVFDTVRIDGLREGVRDAIPFNKLLMPSVLLMMVGIVGLFAMVSVLGQERADGTLRAYRVSPGRLWEFLLSKHLMLLAIGIATFSILYLPMMGYRGYLASLAIMVLTVIIGSSLGAIFGAFFEDPMAAIGWMFVVLIVLGLPAVSLLAPVFSPPWMKLIPSYHTLFGLDAAMFSDSRDPIVGTSILALAGYAIVSLVASSVVFARRTRKEG